MRTVSPSRLDHVYSSYASSASTSRKASASTSRRSGTSQEYRAAAENRDGGCADLITVLNDSRSDPGPEFALAAVRRSSEAVSKSRGYRAGMTFTSTVCLEDSEILTGLPCCSNARRKSGSK